MSVEDADARALEPYTRTWREILDERDALRAKVERYRRALESIAFVKLDEAGCVRIARAALEDTGT